MPRRKRGWIDGAYYHITHRCHNQEFLFRYKIINLTEPDPDTGIFTGITGIVSEF
jgi:hypothetical protein